MRMSNSDCDRPHGNEASYANAFFQATGIDLSLVQEGDKGDFLRSIHSPHCRKMTLSQPRSEECYRFFQSICESARKAGRGKMVNEICPFGRQCGAALLDDDPERKSYLVFGRVLVREASEDATSQVLPAGCYRSAMQVLNLSMPVLKQELRKAYQTPASELSGTVAHARGFIESNFQYGIGCGDIASAVGVSEDHLSRLFRKELGTSLSSFIGKMRMNYAEDLLRETEKNITEVCFESGYGSLSQFNRVFKARFATSPTQFRKWIQLSADDHSR